MTVTRANNSHHLKQCASSPKRAFLLSWGLYFFRAERIGSLIKHVIAFYLSFHKTTASLYGTDATGWKIACLLPFCWNLNMSLTALSLTVFPSSLHVPAPVSRTPVEKPWFIWITTHGFQTLKILNTLLLSNVLICQKPLSYPAQIYLWGWANLSLSYPRETWLCFQEDWGQFILRAYLEECICMWTSQMSISVSISTKKKR